MNLSPLYDAFKNISKELRDNDIMNLGSNMTTKNTSNDVQKKIDIFSNNTLKTAAFKIPEIIGIVSEEDTEFIFKNTNVKSGYVLIFDPMDGSKNVFSNITVGTIYGIYEYDNETDKILSIYETGYALYGPSTLLVRTVNNNRVEQYYLNKENKFIFTHKLELNKKNNICSINMSYNFDDDARNLVKHLIKEGATQRWCGALVADAHQVLMLGGTFIYPRNDNNPNGKIRLIYEAIPFAHIFDILGGCAVDMNNKDILVKLPYVRLQKSNMIHSETSVFLSTSHTSSELNDILEINDIIKC
jgi:fructose-1,6-bisphosphatase I